MVDNSNSAGFPEGFTYALGGLRQGAFRFPFPFSEPDKLKIKGSGSAQKPDLVYSDLVAPNGITFDNDGNVYLAVGQSIPNFIPSIPAAQTFILKIDPTGKFLGGLPLGSISNPRLEFVPESNALISLDENGQFMVIDPTNLSLAGVLNLNLIPLDTSAVLDIATGQVDNFSDFIPNGLSTYGDFDVRVTDNAIEVFISGISSAGDFDVKATHESIQVSRSTQVQDKTQRDRIFPFVSRLTFANGELPEFKGLLSSTADVLSLESQYPRLGRGIAVNSEGTVLTTLPLPDRGLMDFPVAFNADIEFADGISGNEFVFVNTQVDIYSQGLTTDAFGNFYITTNSTGSTRLGVEEEGSLIVASPDLSTFFFARRVGNGATARDVAINPTTDVPFVTVNAKEHVPFIVFENGFLPEGDSVLSFPGAIGPLFLKGDANDNNLVGTSDVNFIMGLGGDDILSGLGGDDQIVGGEGFDHLFGGEGNDDLIGGIGNDFLDGEAGDDLLTGGSGKDVFALSLEGSDVITDFDAAADVFLLRGDIEFSDLTISQLGSDSGIQTLIQGNEQTLATLEGVNSSVITDSLFIPA